MKILAADIGGTNSRFAHFEADQDGKLSLIATKWLKTQDSLSFGHLLQQLGSGEFSLKHDHADIVVVAVAGPVELGLYSSPPFITWNFDFSNVEKDFGFKEGVLMNDFVAQAFACRSPIGKEAEQILSGAIDHNAALAVLGAGTALGKAALVPDESGSYLAVPSEGGHASFPFERKEEFEFQEFLLRELGEEYITAYTVVSGKGLCHIHLFLTGEKLDPQEVTTKFSEQSETLEWAARFYGRVCRNYALEVLALGGVFIAGGVAAKAPTLIKHEAFQNEFRSSSTMKTILQKIPVFLIRNEESGLWGAALYGLQRLQK